MPEPTNPPPPNVLNSLEHGQVPAAVSRDYEERLLELCLSGELDPARWRELGPDFFMAGVAVMLASMPEYDRRQILALAEQLHPGASETETFALWLERSPLRPTRFLGMLEASERS